MCLGRLEILRIFIFSAVYFVFWVPKVLRHKINFWALAVTTIKLLPGHKRDHPYKKPQNHPFCLRLCIISRVGNKTTQEGHSPMCVKLKDSLGVVIVIVKGGKQSQILLCILWTKSYLIGFAQTCNIAIRKNIPLFSLNTKWLHK